MSAFGATHSLRERSLGGGAALAGCAALISPWTASAAIVRLLGWFLIISGVLQGIGLIGTRQVPYFWLELISAVLAIVIGLLLLRHTDAGLLFFSVLLIIHFMIEGIVKTIFRAHHQAVSDWGWVLASGIIGIALAVYLWGNLSTVSEWMLGFLLGILLVVEGAALTSLAWRIRREV